MNKLVLGILAHVDAGKTTLSEALLYQSGALRRLGRVDHGDAFLDTDAMERERGITIFSKQAELPLGNLEATLLDTPGHVDFSAEAERVLQVLDCAVLVVSGSGGVQAHTRTLWGLLERYGVPVFLFINKMDLAGTDRGALLAELKARLDGGCTDFSLPPDQLAEEAAMCDETLLERYLETGEVPEEDLTGLIRRRKLFPCFFGSALKLEGVDALLEALRRHAPLGTYPETFGARVFKVSRDARGARLTWMKVTGGVLKTKDLLTNRRPDTPEEEIWEEKADQLRLYSGEKFRPVDSAPAGTVVAVTGLSRALPGQGLGHETAWTVPALEPVLAYQVETEADRSATLKALRLLEEEDPQLRVSWSGGAIRVQLMGEVQIEILQRRLQERFGIGASFGAGRVVYRETIAGAVEGVGHFEPLRHYAEVHLLLEPLPRGTGLRFGSSCPEDQLDGHWQRLILTHLWEKPHLGVLTGSPITDMRITLTAGRSHLKHTEGGDFRQATYRAVRQGLMSAQSVLLEPWYAFRLELPEAQLGRAINDLQQMGGGTEAPETLGGEAVLTGEAPVAAMGDYAREVAAYTRGQGRLSLRPAGYRPCASPEAVIEAAGYDPERDVENTPDSVFCAHGAGYTVKWNEVPAQAHVDSGIRLDAPEPEPEEAPRRAASPSSSYAGTIEQDKELQAIFERTYGAVKRRDFLPPKAPRRPVSTEAAERRPVPRQPSGPEYLLVDGYNIIFAWEELKAIARESLDAARKALCDLLCNYQGCRKCQVIAVFDAYKVRGGRGSVEKVHNIHVVYTKEAETADAYIERATYELGKRHRVKVATSDGPEQLIILGHGALRVSAAAFREEMEEVQGQIAQALAKNNRHGHGALRAAMEKAEQQQEE
nr:translation factor GTPase family protein [uncultured Oscillibacter sp.]